MSQHAELDVAAWEIYFLAVLPAIAGVSVPVKPTQIQGTVNAAADLADAALAEKRRRMLAAGKAEP